MSLEPHAATSTRTVMPAPAAAGEGRFYLLVLESGSSSMFHLPRNGLVLIGRIAEAELQLQDASVSRRHARLTIADGTVSIADLESHNGTRVNGERVTALRPVASGDVIHVGDVAMVLHRTVRATAAASRTLLPEAMIHERASEEIQRALHFQRVCALVLLQLPPGGRDRAAVQGVIAPVLRPMDAAGWLSDSQLLLVLPELPEAKARALGTELLQELVPALGTAPAVGVASCPFDGCDLETLLVAVRAAVSAGGPAKVRAASEAATDLQMGDRSIVLADPAMLRVFDLLQRLAKSDLPVLIHGETGAVLPPVDEALARSIAAADGPPGARVQAVHEQRTGTLVYPEWNELPVWRVTLDNGDDVYVSPSTGEVRQHADTFFRLVRISFYGLHVWKWSNKPGPATSYLILLGMSVLLALSAATGLFLLLRPRLPRRSLRRSRLACRWLMPSKKSPI